MRKAMSVVVAGTLAGALAFSATPANAAANATTPVSQSTARILAGSIASTNLDTIAKLAGTQAQNFGGATVKKDVTPDLQLLNDALTVPLGQLKGALSNAIPGLSLQGLLEEKVVAKADGSATGDASVAGLGLDLGTLTAGATDALASLTLGLGAVTAHAQQAPNPHGHQSGSCDIAGLTLDLTSPLLAKLLNTITTTLQPVLDSASTALNTLLGNLGVVKIQTIDAHGHATNGLPSLASIVDKLTDIDLADGAIEINLQTGTVHVDLAELLDSVGLNFCENPNSKPLKVLADALANDIPDALSGIVSSALESVTGLLQLCTAQVKTSCIKITIGTVDVSAAAGNLLNTVISDVTGIVGDLTDALKPILATVGDLLGKLSDALSGIIDLTTNKQSTSGGTFSETALELTLLSGAPALPASKFAAAGDPLLKVDLSNATVGPQSVLPTSTPPSSTPPSSTPPIKVDAGRPGPADGGLPLVWIGLVLLLGGVGGAALLRMKAARHS